MSPAARIVGVIALVGLAAAACAPTPQVLAPAPLEARSQIHRIGILGPPPPPVTFGEEPASGAGWGYLKGMGACFDGMTRGGSGEGAALIFAAAIVGCPTVGGLVGAVQNPSAAEVEAARAALEQFRGDRDIGEALRGELAALLARDTPQYEVSVLGRDERDRDSAASHVDTLIELDNLVVAFMRCDRHYHTLPPLTLYAAVDAELVRADDRAVLHRARLEYWGESFPFAAWGAANAERFALGVARGQRNLAEQLVQSFFVAQTPTEMRWPRCLNQPWRRW